MSVSVSLTRTFLSVAGECFSLAVVALALFPAKLRSGVVAVTYIGHAQLSFTTRHRTAAVFFRVPRRPAAIFYTTKYSVIIISL